MAGGILSLSLYISFFFNAVIAIEINIQIKSNSISSHQKRKNIYFVIITIFTIFAGLFGILTDSFGMNFLGFCFYKENTYGT